MTEESAARPMSDEERENLKELKAREAEDARAAAEQEAAEAAEAQEARREEAANRPLFHVLARHMGRSARTRTMRAGRAGHRRQGILLDNGTRIRKKGKGRYTEIDLRELVRNHQRFLEYVRVGAMEICDPKTEYAIPYDDLVKLISEVGAWVSDREYELAMNKYEQALDAYKEAHKVWKRDDGAESTEPAKPEKPEQPKDGDIEVNESGVQDEPVVGSNEMNVAPNTPIPATGTGTGLLDDEGNEADEGEGEEGEEGDSEGEGDSITEVDLKKMHRDQVDEVARNAGFDPSKYSKKEDLIEALLSSGEE